MQGQVYVRVEADAATYSVEPMGSSGQFEKGYIIYWKRDGGVTGTFGWPDGYIPLPTDTVEVINAKIEARWDAIGKDGRNRLFRQWSPICAELM